MTRTLCFVSWAGTLEYLQTWKKLKIFTMAPSDEEISKCEDQGISSRYNNNTYTKEFSRDIRIPLKQRFSYGVGHVVNDLSAYAAFSYILVFWTRVVGIPHSSTGILFLVAQVADALSSPFIGYMCDRCKVPLLSRLGRRKGWHLFGTILLLLLNPFLFGRCFLCSVGKSSWYPVIYYSVIITTIQVGFASVQISHLSLLSEIARKPSQAVELNSIR